MNKLQVGDKVRFKGGVIPEQVVWANSDYPSNLVIGNVYLIETVNAHPSYTRVTLKNTQGVYNSVHFTKL